MAEEQHVRAVQINDDLLDLYHSDPYVFAGLNLFLRGQISYKEALEKIVLVQCSAIRKLEGMAENALSRTATPQCP